MARLNKIFDSIRYEVIVTRQDLESAYGMYIPSRAIYSAGALAHSTVAFTASTLNNYTDTESTVEIVDTSYNLRNNTYVVTVDVTYNINLDRNSNISQKKKEETSTPNVPATPPKRRLIRRT